MTPARWRKLTQAQRDELAAHLDALLAAEPSALHFDEQVALEDLLELEKAVGSLHADRPDIRRALIRIV